MTKQQSEEPSVATPQQTRLWYLDRADRNFAPIRRSFIQKPPGIPSRHGPLAKFVRTGNKRALTSYLFVVGITSSDLGGDGWKYSLHSRIWARALGTTEHATNASSLTAVSRTFDYLQEERLITWEREGNRSREITVTLLREDGSGQNYTRPGRPGESGKDPYIKLSDAFWRKGLDQKLTLPGIAMLLVASAEFRHFKLASERVPDWYGWSADTAERGFRDLKDNGLIVWTSLAKSAPNMPAGVTVSNHYSLARPFSHRSRSRSKKVKT